jgi:adenylate kinase
VLAFEVEESQLIDRLSHRGRSDDDLEIIRERFWQHKRLTQPLLEYYGSRGLLKEIRAEGTPDEVFAKVHGAVEAAKAAVRQ